MKYYELTCKAYLKRDIHFQDSFEAIRKYIKFCLSKDSEFSKIYEKNSFRYYCFDNFSEAEKDGIYKKSKEYRLRIRSFDAKLISFLSKSLRENINNPNFLILSTSQNEIKQRFIYELNSITPVIITTEERLFWTYEKDGDILKFQKQLQDNLEKKYQSFFKEPIHPSQNFIQLLEFINKKPQTITFTKNNKKLKFFGNKIKIIPNEDENSQKLAFTALACGLGEKNSFGGGFCANGGVG